MNTKQLKDSILQHAVQGKLVSQNPDDGNAKQLIKEIMEEKDRLIKAKVIKKEKTLPPIIEEEIPFDVPSSWEWVRIRDIYYNSGQKKPDSDFCYIDVACIDNQKGQVTSGYQILNGNNAPSRARKIVKYGEVIYSTVRPYLQNIAVIDKNFEYETIASTAFIVMCPIKIYNKFLFYVLKSPYFNALVESKMQGATYPAINDANFNNLIIPIPPLKEQFRIVEKIEKLLVEVENYDIAYTNVEILKNQFPLKLENSILQYAMKGKLVEQNPSDEPAQQLIEKIQLEKDLLIKEKVIKKEKPLPPITEEEIPFDIPSSWEWVRLKDLTQIIGDGLHGTPKYDNQGDYYFINGSNLKNNRIVFNDQTKRVSKETYELYSKTLDHRTILMSINGTLGSLAKYQGEPVILGKSAAYITLMSNEILEYIYLYLQSPIFKEFYEKKYTGTTIKNIPLSAIRECPIPLPPLSEQKRIVTAVGDILQVKNRLT